MTKLKTTLIAAALLGVASPALAGSPDNPGEQGEKVNTDKAGWQNQPGAGPNAWGQTVSRVATEQDGGNNETSLGNFLNYMSGGPNPFNDNGKGND